MGRATSALRKGRRAYGKARKVARAAGKARKRVTKPVKPLRYHV